MTKKIVCGVILFFLGLMSLSYFGFNAFAELLFNASIAYAIVFAVVYFFTKSEYTKNAEVGAAMRKKKENILK